MPRIRSHVNKVIDHQSVGNVERETFQVDGRDSWVALHADAHEENVTKFMLSKSTNYRRLHLRSARCRATSKAAMETATPALSELILPS
jgi:hypothetical protein